MKVMSPAWKAEPLINCLLSCRAMLAIHGVLTTAEATKVKRRILKKVRSEAKNEH